jgi:hypothetical protein
LLHAIRLAFRPLRAEPFLRRCGLGTENAEHLQGKKRFQQLHKPALRPKRRLRIRAQNTHGESNPEHFSVNTPIAERRSAPICQAVHP